MPRHLIMALDPGLITGCVVAFEDATPVQVSELQSFEGFLRCVKTYSIGTIVYEDFRIQPGKGDTLTGADLHSSEFIGALKYWQAQNPQVELVRQQPAQRKLVADATLKATEWWRATKGKHHARDAARHLLLFLITKRGFAPAAFRRTKEAEK